MLDLSNLRALLKLDYLIVDVLSRLAKPKKRAQQASEVEGLIRGRVVFQSMLTRCVDGCLLKSLQVLFLVDKKVARCQKLIRHAHVRER